MKSEKFFRMLNDVEDKYVEKASKVLELQQEAREGISVSAERPRKAPLWKLVTAVSCSAAALLGAFMLITNVPKIGNIGNSGNAGSEGVQSAALSEQLANYKITNLDYENAVITENAPASGQWKKLSYKIPGINEQTPDRLEKIAAAYGATINKDEIMARIINNYNIVGYDPFSTTYRQRYDELQFTDDHGNDIPFNGVFYVSD